jgi:hypothetical protein
MTEPDEEWPDTPNTNPFGEQPTGMERLGDILDRMFGDRLPPRRGIVTSAHLAADGPPRLTRELIERTRDQVLANRSYRVPPGIPGRPIGPTAEAEQDDLHFWDSWPLPVSAEDDPCEFCGWPRSACVGDDRVCCVDCTHAAPEAGQE